MIIQLIQIVKTQLWLVHSYQTEEDHINFKIVQLCCCTLLSYMKICVMKTILKIHPIRMATFKKQKTISSFSSNITYSTSGANYVKYLIGFEINTKNIDSPKLRYQTLGNLSPEIFNSCIDDCRRAYHVFFCNVARRKPQRRSCWRTCERLQWRGRERQTSLRLK